MNLTGKPASETKAAIDKQTEQKLAGILADPEKLQKQRISTKLELAICRAAREALDDGMPQPVVAALLRSAAITVFVGGIEIISAAVKTMEDLRDKLEAPSA